MSSNNFYRIMKIYDQYAVEMGWAEDDDGLDDVPDEHAIWFDTLDDAMEYVGGQYSEYGMTYVDNNHA